MLSLRETETRRNTSTGNQVPGTTVDANFEGDFRNESGLAYAIYSPQPPYGAISDEYVDPQEDEVTWQGRMWT